MKTAKQNNLKHREVERNPVFVMTESYSLAHNFSKVTIKS